MTHSYRSALINRSRLTEGLQYMFSVEPSQKWKTRKQLTTQGFTDVTTLPSLKLDGTTDETVWDVYAKRIMMLPVPREYIDSWDIENIPVFAKPEDFMRRVYRTKGFTDVIVIQQSGINGEFISGRFDVYGRKNGFTDDQKATI